MATDGWWLKNDGQFTVVYETMPPDSSEKKHYHKLTEQFFYCLQGQLTIEFQKYEQVVQEHEGISIKCVFRPKSNTYFGISRTPITDLPEHPFRFTRTLISDLPERLKRLSRTPISA